MTTGKLEMKTLTLHLYCIIDHDHQFHYNSYFRLIISYPEEINEDMPKWIWNLVKPHQTNPEEDRLVYYIDIFVTRFVPYFLSLFVFRT